MPNKFRFHVFSYVCCYFQHAIERIKSWCDISVKSDKQPALVYHFTGSVHKVQLSPRLFEHIIFDATHAWNFNSHHSPWQMVIKLMAFAFVRPCIFCVLLQNNANRHINSALFCWTNCKCSSHLESCASCTFKLIPMTGKIYSAAKISHIPSAWLFPHMCDSFPNCLVFDSASGFQLAIKLEVIFCYARLAGCRVHTAIAKVEDSSASFWVRCTLSIVS